MKTALFLSPEPPYPATTGGALRSASILEYLAQHYTVDVITFRQPGATDPRDAFPENRARTVQVIDLPYHSKSTLSRTARNALRLVKSRPPLLDRFSGFELRPPAEYDLGLIEHFWCAPYESQLRPHCRKLLLDLHNIESVWHASLAAAEPAPLKLVHRHFASAYRVLEKQLLPRFDTLLAASWNDATRVKHFAPTVIYPNCIPFTPVPRRNERNVILFTGNLEYQPNISAVRYFRDRIWPALKNRWPDIVWELAGMNDHAIKPLIAGDPHIHVTGPFEHATLRIAEAKVAIVPLLAGSGTRLKILEAWAAATPVVSTSIGAEGLNYIAGQDILIADQPHTFVRAVSELLASEEKRNQIGQSGRLLFERSYTWERGWIVLDKCLTDGS